MQLADSIALLESFTTVEGDAKGRITDGAVSAIALHADPAADATLERLVAPGQPESLRKKVTFAIFAETDNLDQVTAMVEELFTLLEKDLVQLQAERSGQRERQAVA